MNPKKKEGGDSTLNHQGSAAATPQTSTPDRPVSPNQSNCLTFKPQDSDGKLEQKFEQFHRDNPHVYATLVDFCQEWIVNTGRDRLGVAALWERLRWDLTIQTRGDIDFKLNNDLKAFYARLLMLQEPSLRGLFELRRSRADEWAAGRLAAREATSTDTSTVRIPEPRRAVEDREASQ